VVCLPVLEEIGQFRYFGIKSVLAVAALADPMQEAGAAVANVAVWG
jgi:hypothetical protein